MNKNVEYFSEHGYCLIKNVLSTEIIDLITQYSLFDEMQDFSADGMQVPNAHSKYADPLMETVLLKLHPLMEEYTGMQLFPTYSFYRVYRHGDELGIHKDRPSCEISATMCVNYSYNDNEYSWPILMNGFRAELKPGDMLIYRGCELEHWREKFNNDVNDWHVQSFFHYVNANGPFKDYKFDNRNSIGERKVNKKNFEKSYIQFL